ncbi:MAG: hypothetical protein HY975_00480, partial [Candidatus Kerfeldbacteria bacterium]|nr:hypothetical protein [Candidatus Kerfeldbacteria bacterium]
TDIFRQYFPATFDGLISGANVQLRRDTYTGDIWAATFRGVSRYKATGDTWESYGSGAGIDFAGVRDIAFTPTAAWIFVTPNAYTKGGMLSFDKASKQWAAHNETNNLKLDRDDIKFTTLDADVWAVGRPNDWVSAAKSRDADVYRYRGTTGTWQKITEVNKTLLATDHVSAVTTVDGQIVLTVERKDRSLVDMVVNPSTQAVTTRAVPPTFIEQYGAAMGYPSLMDITYATLAGELMTSSGTSFNTANGQQDTSLTLAIKEFVAQNPNAGNLQPVACNQWNDATQDVWLENSNEMGGGTYGLYLYRRATKTVEQALSAEDWDRAVAGSSRLTCIGKIVTVLDKTGAAEYDISTKVMKTVGTGFVDLQAFLGSDNHRAYFTAANNRVGMYDLTTKTFTYVAFPLPTGLSTDALRYHTVTDRGVWFTSMPSGDTTKPVNTAYVFNPTNGSWTTYSLQAKLKAGEQITAIQGVGDEVWLTTSLNPYSLRPGGSEFILVDKAFRAGMMSDDVQKIFATPNGVWFTNSFGLWGNVD